MFGLPHNIVFLIILLLFMAAAVIFTFVFVRAVDRSVQREERQQATGKDPGAGLAE